MSALDDYRVKRSETRRAEMVELTAAVVSGMLASGVYVEETPESQMVKTAVSAARKLHREIDRMEGDGF